jgi:fumarate hydratase class II
MQPKIKQIIKSLIHQADIYKWIVQAELFHLSDQIPDTNFQFSGRRSMVKFMVRAPLRACGCP